MNANELRRQADELLPPGKPVRQASVNTAFCYVCQRSLVRDSRCHIKHGEQPDEHEDAGERTFDDRLREAEELEWGEG